MKIAFLGTPDFALPSLKMLHERGDDVVVFTQPGQARWAQGGNDPAAGKKGRVRIRHEGLPV